MNPASENIGSFILGLYSLILILLGTPLNLFCFYIFKRLIPNRSNATIIVLSYLSLIELLIPFTWNLNYAVRELIWKRQATSFIANLEEHSLFVCKVVSFSAYFLLQCAAWLKTLASFTRCVSLHQEWPIRNTLLKPPVIHRLSCLMIVLFALINLPILFINGKRGSKFNPSTNRTEMRIQCYQSRFFYFWEIVHSLLYNFIPFASMILCNYLIIRHVQNSRERTQGTKPRSPSARKTFSIPSSPARRSLTKNNSRLTKTLIFVTIFFIIFTSPSAIFYIAFGKLVNPYRRLITMLFSDLATTNHVFSFLIYWLTSIDFRDAVVNLCCCRPIILSPKTSLENKIIAPQSLSPTLTSRLTTAKESSLLRSSQSL